MSTYDTLCCVTLFRASVASINKMYSTKPYSELGGLGGWNTHDFGTFYF